MTTGREIVFGRFEVFMGTQVAAKRVAITDLVAGLRQLPATAFEGTEQVRSYLASAVVEPETLAPYLTWNAQHYTRNLIDKTALYELIAICWDVGQVSSVHNHRDQNCWMSAPIGRLRVENYRVRAEDTAAGSCELDPTDAVELDATHPCAVDPKEPVHRVLNPREYNQRAVSLHVYSRPFDSCVVYSPEQGTRGEIKLHYDTAFGQPVKK